MAVPVDRVQVLKQESTAGGGDASDQSGFNSWDPINETEDALSAAGLFVQKQGGPADENAVIWREGADMKFKDETVAGGATLAQLLSGTSADQLGQVMFSIDGAFFTKQMPLTGGDSGWLVNDDGNLLVVG